MSDRYLTLIARVSDEIQRNVLQVPIEKRNQKWFFTDYSPFLYECGTHFTYMDTRLRLLEAKINGVFRCPFIDAGYQAVCLFTSFPRWHEDLEGLKEMESFGYNPDCVKVYAEDENSPAA